MTSANFEKIDAGKCWGNYRKMPIYIPASRNRPSIGIPDNPVCLLIFQPGHLNFQKAAWTCRVGREHGRHTHFRRLLAAADKAGVLGFVSADVNGAETDTGVAVEVGEDAHSIYYEVITCVHCGGAGEKAEIVVCSIYKKRGGLFVTLYG